ncbi:helix-turn-helix transcriptional regulator [Limosilactobacillus sp. STM2_1]|uniref:Helix-turn-helix transcriptional regulator n=1 Tax=Limosilactobacillus rudii TaxID=2759755 RepID=A0A7W3UMX4_9LACO|nr:helix-turn-helix transcriptional regulator [Limosilactobacillus rudii]MBB1080468.1 helix-turn-helix transcriptional regulator [Limosilactobacillus rudii]MBB1098494.1 helix-turn-helix transcriptional regulator [Limosilactobacillus rudii]MCD7135502.1 helix-turn-helix domain-containing protein [Limosilactobacillus rudii]
MRKLLGENIANRRHQLNMTQQQLAELSELSINFISRLERGGSSDVSSSTLLKLATALNTSMESLMTNGNITTPTKRGPQLTQLINKLEGYDYAKAESLSKAILQILNEK